MTGNRETHKTRNVPLVNVSCTGSHVNTEVLAEVNTERECHIGSTILNESKVRQQSLLPHFAFIQYCAPNVTVSCYMWALVGNKESNHIAIALTSSDPCSYTYVRTVAFPGVAQYVPIMLLLLYVRITGLAFFAEILLRRKLPKVRGGT